MENIKDHEIWAPVISLLAENYQNTKGYSVALFKDEIKRFINTPTLTTGSLGR